MAAAPAMPPQANGDPNQLLMQVLMRPPHQFSSFLGQSTYFGFGDGARSR